MSQTPTTELALFETIFDTSLSTIPKPAASSAKTKAALRRCTAAWQRAFNAYMEASGGETSAHVFAAHNADKAYRRAMPLLVGHDGVRDFIACATHGILIGAIPPNQASQLLYAAQVALGSLHLERSRPIPGSKADTPTPRSAQNRAAESPYLE